MIEIKILNKCIKSINPPAPKKITHYKTNPTSRIGVYIWNSIHHNNGDRAAQFNLRTKNIGNRTRYWEHF